jgi:hypothetical protein
VIGEFFLFKAPVRKMALIVKSKWSFGQNDLNFLNQVEDLIESEERGNEKLIQAR